MKINKRLMTFFIAFALILSFIPLNKVKAAAIADIDIVSSTKVTVKQAEEWAKSKGATDTFVGLAKLYWQYSDECGDVNPGIAYVQAAKETGYGKFGGVLDDSYKNPCGMKTSAGGGDYDPNAHQRFNSWDEGVQAHLDHLALYAGANGYPKSNTYDPRHFVTIKGKAPTVNSLGGKWAPSATYGEDVNKLYNDLLKSSGVEVPKEDLNDSTDKNDSTSNNDKNESENVSTEITLKPQEVPTSPEVTEPIKISNDYTTNISSTIGWRLEGGRWYYYRNDNSKATGWIKPDNNWYYLYSDGAMATGWANANGVWYYFKSSGAMQLGWLKDAGKWYYLQGDGSMTTGFKKIDNKIYFLDVSGAMRTGWFQISGQWYYFSSNGDMLTGWIKPSNEWYYLYSNGIMANGWINLNNDWYHLSSSGAMSTGWVANGSDYYYLDYSSGKMLKDTVKDGWKIGPNGVRGERVNGSGPSSGSKLIVVDPGHNFGGDDGAYATHSGVTYSERDLNMQVAVKLKSKLEDMGYRVVLTRTESDRETLPMSQSLANRVNLANNIGADLFVSLHHNSAGSASASGVETYYSTRAQDSSFGGAYNSSRIATSKAFASAINNSIVNKTGAVNRGAKDGNLFVCRNANMPSVLVELGFITNVNEAINCSSSSYQDLSASAIAEAISSRL
ncbi:MAG: N-acetylmuramoyl-L-alanine amidase [Clostridium sp.]|nr:N-acetylmuramoyl-L-alanine amidase [Clostridium sp.]